MNAQGNPVGSRLPVAVSVVIPTYNCWPLLQRAVSSALAQTFSPHEIIVVDDGSTNPMPAALRKELDRRIIYHRQSNGGPSRARNAGARLSTSTWLAFLDADDEWRRDKLEKQVACIRNERVALVACDAVIRDEAGSEIGRRLLPQPFDTVNVKRELQVRTVIPMGVLVRKDAFLALGGFNEELVCGEDREMWARLIARFDVAAVHEPLLLVTDREGSVSQNGTRVLRDGLIVNRRVSQLFRPKSTFGAVMANVMLRKADSNLYWSAAWLSAKARRRGLAIRQALRSLWLFPFSNLKGKLLLLVRVVVGQQA